MKILSLPKHENLTTGEKYCGKEKLLLRSIFSFPQYFHYISNFKSPVRYKFVNCGCSDYFFLNSVNLICQGMDISKYSESPLKFEIMRVNCITFPSSGCDLNTVERDVKHQTIIIIIIIRWLLRLTLVLLIPDIHCLCK